MACRSKMVIKISTMMSSLRHRARDVASCPKRTQTACCPSSSARGTSHEGNPSRRLLWDQEHNTIHRGCDRRDGRSRRPSLSPYERQNQQLEKRQSIYDNFNVIFFTWGLASM